jgi:hypothetical protein
MSAARPPRPPLPPEPPTAVRTPRDGYLAPAPAAPPAGAPLPPPEDPRWWERGWWAALLAAIAGLIVGGIVGAALAEPENTRTVPGGPGRTVTVKGPTHTVTHVVVRTRTVTTGSPATGSEGAGGGGHVYTGNGSESLGTITVSQPSTVRWRASAGFLSMRNSPEDEQSLSVSSRSTSGSSPVEPGTYHEVRVNSPGEWTLTISPG